MSAASNNGYLVNINGAGGPIPPCFMVVGNRQPDNTPITYVPLHISNPPINAPPIHVINICYGSQDCPFRI